MDQLPRCEQVVSLDLKSLSKLSLPTTHCPLPAWLRKKAVKEKVAQNEKLAKGLGTQAALVNAFPYILPSTKSTRDKPHGETVRERLFSF